MQQVTAKTRVGWIASLFILVGGQAASLPDLAAGNRANDPAHVSRALNDVVSAVCSDEWNACAADKELCSPCYTTAFPGQDCSGTISNCASMYAINCCTFGFYSTESGSSCASSSKLLALYACEASSVYGCQVPESYCQPIAVQVDIVVDAGDREADEDIYVAPVDLAQSGDDALDEDEGESDTDDADDYAASDNDDTETNDEESGAAATAGRSGAAGLWSAAFTFAASAASMTYG